MTNSRDEFEKSIYPAGGNFDRNPQRPDEYRNTYLQATWEGWQAARAWLPISEYKTGDAIFYMPAITNSSHPQNNRMAAYSLDRWASRKPTHFQYITEPE